MRLRYIEKVDFRKSEKTNFEEVMKRKKLTLRSGDVVLFISSNEKQLVFIHGFKDVDVHSGRTERPTGDQTQVLFSSRYRICGRGGWNPLMLANYAAEAGIVLSGIRRFEDYYQKLIA